MQVAEATVVFKTRARRLYDIANALAALGLVEKVRFAVFTRCAVCNVKGARCKVQCTVPAPVPMGILLN